MKETKDTLVNAIEPLVAFLASHAHTGIEAENFEGTPERVARMYMEMCWPPQRIALELLSIYTKTFPVNDSEEPGMITQGPIVLNSMCPHHLFPVRYHAYVGYLPKKGNNVLGLSKLARIPDVLSKRFVLQEQLAKDIADAFYCPKHLPVLKDIMPHPIFETDGSIAMLVGQHTCEACRGIQQDARTLVTERRGGFRDELLESRFMQAAGIVRAERPFGS